MSEVDLAAMARCGKDDDEKAPKPLQEINEVLKVCTFGKFQARLLFTSFFAFMNGILVSNTTPYILPNAECDLNLNLLQKGILNAVPFVGMVFVSVVAGILTDTFGRKPFLVYGYGGISFFIVIASLSQTFEMLLIAKFCEGCLFAAAFSPAMSFTSEYCHNGIRDRVMLFQSSYQSIGQVVLALMSWGLLTQNWHLELFEGSFVMNTWNFYLMTMSTFSLIASVLYSFLPESPKYLLTQHRYDEARETLIKIYMINTGKARETFPYLDIWKNQMKPIDENPEKNVKISLKRQLVTGLRNVKPIFRKPLGPYLALFCSMNFCIMILYNVVRLWFPQLSTIVEHYSNDTNTNQDLCVILDAYTDDLRTRTANVSIEVVEKCVPVKSGTETYINTVIVGCVCIPPYMLSGVLVNIVGKKALEMVAGLITIAATFSLRWARTKFQVVALFAIDLAISQVMMSLLQACTVEVFPTSSRTVAVSTIMTAGRIGTLVGNIMFPILLDMGCVVPLFALGGVMICVTTLSVFLPKKKKN